MGSCSSRGRTVPQISELDLRASVQNSEAPKRVRTSVFRQSVALSDSSNGFSSKRVDVSLSASFAKPEDSDNDSAELLSKLTGIDIRVHAVVMVTLGVISKRADKKSSVVRTLAVPTIDWGNLSVERQVPKRIPTEITVQRFQVFAILEPNSSLTSTIQIRGKMKEEKVLMMCAIDGKEKSVATVHDELFSYLEIKKVGDNTCRSCKGNVSRPGEDNSDANSAKQQHDERKGADNLKICRRVSLGESDEGCSLNRSPVPNIAVSPISFRELPPLGRMSMSSQSTIAQVGSLSNSPVGKESICSMEEHEFQRRTDQLQQQQHHQIITGIRAAKKRQRRPTPITTRAPMKLRGKKTAMQIFFEDAEEHSNDEEETNRKFGGVGESSNAGEIPAISVDRKWLPSIEGDSRPPSAVETLSDARYSRKFMLTPVLENNEDVERESGDEGISNKNASYLPPIKPKSAKSRVRKLSQVDRPLPIE